MPTARTLDAPPELARTPRSPLEVAHDVLRRGALEKRPELTTAFSNASVAWCDLPAHGMPVALIETVTTGRVVPFVDCPMDPSSTELRHGHWYDSSTRTAYCDIDLIALVAGAESRFASTAIGMGVALAFADRLLAERERQPNVEERFAIAGAIVRRFIARNAAPELAVGAASSALVLLRESLASKGEACPASSRAMRLTDPSDDPAASRAFRRGFEDPELGFLEWLRE